MNLVIDQGNSICKVAIYEGDIMVCNYAFPRLSLMDAKDIILEYPDLKRAIYSSVGGVDKYLIRLLKDYIPFTIAVDKDTPMPIRVNYDRSTLGSDRLAVAVAAFELTGGGREIFVIDSGTAITYERVSADGVYLGGNISPGFQTRFKALHHFTSRLPLVEYSDVAEGYSPFGSNTREAIESGVTRGLVYEIDGYIDDLRMTHPDLVVYLTGGDSQYFECKIKNDITVVKDLVLLGLNRILEYNYNHAQENN
ncbi:type III pantothenate kinase [Porphyromonas pogonae]|uniref:type III pantothenate kinase n=1 Tax=Porphyromonas pogonae TaxID=867595 RepID=UPI002E783C8C|nr:type III pantothenate kinase [Porphyromonas pogonae]